MRPAYEVADILKNLGAQYLQSNQLSYQKRKVLRAIVNCRTAALGGHIQSCSHCDYERVAYNSCRNRHCPKCQIQQREKWMKARKEQVLPVKYFHLVFTIPGELNKLCLQHPKQLYNTLFYAAWQSLKIFAKDEKHLGAKTGMISILHTWGQNLSLHPHLHCIVPAGGITINNEWKEARGKGKYLFPVKAMSIVYRALFLKRLKELENKGEIKYHGLQKLVNLLFRKPWIVYAKRPFNGVASVIEYLGRYSHKVAISNHRITNIDHEKVSFRYKNYRSNKLGVMTLKAKEFIRRFSQHILPHRFVRIRHFGIFASRNKVLLAAFKKQLIDQQTNNLSTAFKDNDTNEDNLICCPKCKNGILEKIALPIRAGPIKI